MSIDVQCRQPGLSGASPAPAENDSGVLVLGITLIVGFVAYAVHCTLTLVTGTLLGWLFLSGLSEVLTPSAQGLSHYARAAASLRVSVVILGVALLAALLVDLVSGVAALRGLHVTRQRGLRLAILVTLVVAWLVPAVLLAATVMLGRTDLSDLTSLAAWLTVLVVLMVLPTLRVLLLTAGIVLLATSGAKRLR